MIKKFLILLTAGLVLSACGNRTNEEADVLEPLPVPTLDNTSIGTVPDIATNLGSGLPGPLDGAAVDPVASIPIVNAPRFARGSQEELRASAGDRVFFQTDAADLDGRAQAILSNVAQWVINTPNRTIVIEGHADERGTREYNLALGDRRSNAVRNFLISQGVSPNRIQTVSFGKERPMAAGSNPRSWALNRRAVFTVR